MQRYFGALTFLALIVMVMVQVQLMRRKGIKAMNFASMDKKDFLIPPFAIFYFCVILAHAFRWPLGRQEFFDNEIVSWIGVLPCLLGLLLLAMSIVSFGNSFRVGIDTTHADSLVTTGVFSISRNPIYVAFGLVLLGEFLAFPSWIPAVYFVAGAWLMNRQVLREEFFLNGHYGKEYQEYCMRVRRYL